LYISLEIDFSARKPPAYKAGFGFNENGARCELKPTKSFLSRLETTFAISWGFATPSDVDKNAKYYLETL